MSRLWWIVQLVSGFAKFTCCSSQRSSARRQDTAMYPTSLTQLARANPFSAPLFTLQKVEEPQQSLHGQRTRRLAAAAVAEGNPVMGLALAALAALA